MGILEPFWDQLSQEQMVTLMRFAGRGRRQEQEGNSKRGRTKRFGEKGPFDILKGNTQTYNIFQKQTKKMFGNFRVHDFNNMDLCSFYDLDFSLNASPDFGKQLPPTAFPDAQKEMNTDYFHEKSTEDIAGGYEISFEKDFMKEHETVFRKALGNFMEFCGISLQQPNVQLEDYLKALEEEEASCFKKKLQYYDKLSSFLKIVVAQTPQAIAKLLIPVTLKLVNIYDDLKMSEPTLEDILEEATGVTRSFHFEKLMFVNDIGVSKKDLVEQGKEFLEVYCATVMVVTAQYFQNPYSDDQDDFKRPFVLSDDSEEDSIEPTPCKKRKFSF